ncbi:IS110 family transposase, partial [Dictyobacter formicarum]|uniref:IS110 family transposase n=1 Tax=Dictyobacter formicarum TaxID=2778368 RepID=UPI001914EED3
MTLALIVIAAYLGIDVAHDQLEVVFRIQRRSHHTQIPNTPSGWHALGEWVQRFQLAASSIHAYLEATGSYSDGISDWLVQAGFRVSVLNPSILAGYRAYQHDHAKTDLCDATLLAQFAEKEEPAPYVPLPAEVIALRRLVRFRQQLLKMVGQTQHRFIEDLGTLRAKAQEFFD